MNGNDVVIGQAHVIADLHGQVLGLTAELDAERQHTEALRARLAELECPPPAGA